MVMPIALAKEPNLLECEKVSRKVEQGTYFRELSSKASI